MAITDELREWSKDRFFMGNGWQEIRDIADRIDREHRTAMEKVAAEADALPMTDESMAEHGWVRLPLDADGVPIRVGDVMEWPTTGETFEVVGIGDGTVFYVDGGCDECADWTGASTKRHHHTPTVEDVLREFADEVQRCCDTEDTIAEYAAKLRLAGDE